MVFSRAETESRWSQSHAKQPDLPHRAQGAGCRVRGQPAHAAEELALLVAGLAASRHNTLVTAVVFLSQVEADLVSQGRLAEPGFSFGANGVADVAAFRYGLDTNPPTTAANATTFGGSASVSITPATAGAHTLYVRSRDRAGDLPPTTGHAFTVESKIGSVSSPTTERREDSAFGRGGVHLYGRHLSVAARRDGLLGHHPRRKRHPGGGRYGDRLARGHHRLRPVPGPHLERRIDCQRRGSWSRRDCRDCGHAWSFLAFDPFRDGPTGRIAGITEMVDEHQHSQLANYLGRGQPAILGRILPLRQPVNIRHHGPANI